MLLFKLALDVEELKNFPAKNWNEEPSQYWLELCNQLQTYYAIPSQFELINESRKWEYVSAYQKCVRRGMKDVAMGLVTGFALFPKKEWAYFWRRICTTVVEDVGFASPGLMLFTIACSTIYKPSNTTIFSDIMHNKFVIFGKNISNKPLLWTGSFNFTKSAQLKNQENVVILDEQYLIQKYEKQFEVIKKRISYSSSSKVAHVKTRRSQKNKKMDERVAIA